MQKTIIDAFADTNGNIASVLFKGNKNPTPVATAIRMASKGDISNSHLLKSRGKRPCIRSNPDGLKGNNLSAMAKKNKR